MSLFKGASMSGYGNAPKSAQVDGEVAERGFLAAQTSTEFMRQDINRLLLITEALWMLLKKQNGYTDEDLSAVVNEIDLRDGVLDGKGPKADPNPCPSCGRMVAPHRNLCIFCGSPVPPSLFGR